MIARLVRPRLSLRGLMVLIAVWGVALSIGLWGWKQYVSPIHRWLRMLGDEHAGLARFEIAGNAIEGKDPAISPEVAMSALIVALTNPNEKVRADAAWALGWGGPRASRAIPALIEELSDRETEVRVNAVDALTMIARYQIIAGTSRVAGADRARATRALIEALHDPDPRVRRAAARLGLIIGPEDRPWQAAIAALMAALDDPDPGVNWSATRSLTCLEDWRATGPRLMEVLSRHQGLRGCMDDTIRILFHLARHGNPARRGGARTVLEAGLRNPDRDVRLAVGQSLSWLGRGASALPVAAETLRAHDTCELQLLGAMDILKAVGPRDPGARALLQEAEHHGNLDVRRAATAILGGYTGPLPLPRDRPIPLPRASKSNPGGVGSQAGPTS